MNSLHQRTFRPRLIVAICLITGADFQTAYAQTVPSVVDDPLFSKFYLGMDYKAAQRIGRSGSRSGGFREIGSLRFMTVYDRSEAMTGTLIADRRNGKITSIMSFANKSISEERVISLLPTYVKSINIVPGTLLDTTWTRHSGLPSTIFCTLGGQYAVSYQKIETKGSPPRTEIAVVSLPWLEEQLTESRKIRKRLGDSSKKDLRDVCK